MFLRWDEWFKIEVCHRADSLIFDVRDKDHAYTEAIGIVEISTQHLISNQVIDRWFDITKGHKVTITTILLHQHLFCE